MIEKQEHLSAKFISMDRPIHIQLNATECIAESFKNSKIMYIHVWFCLKVSYKQKIDLCRFL